jgi:choline transport protein
MLVNGALGFATYIFILYCIGDPTAALTGLAGEPFVEVFYNALGSKAGTTALTSLLVAMYIFATFGFVASASRQAWAFARNNGLPLSGLFKKVCSTLPQAVSSVLMLGVRSIPDGLSLYTPYSSPASSTPYSASLISGMTPLKPQMHPRKPLTSNNSSSVAFNAIVSLTTSAYLSSYIIAILLMALKRIRGEAIHLGPWNLGRWGLPINIFAVAYSTMTVIFSFFPPEVPVTAATMNYACAVYGGVILLGIVYYMLRGRHKFVGPSTELDVVE